MNNIQELRNIIADAPECTQMYSLTSDGVCFPLFQCEESGEWLCWSGFEWSPTDLEIGEQLIESNLLKELIEQEEENQALKARVAELEKDISFLQSCVNSGETASIADRPSKRAKQIKEQWDE